MALHSLLVVLALFVFLQMGDLAGIRKKSEVHLLETVEKVDPSLLPSLDVAFQWNDALWGNVTTRYQ